MADRTVKINILGDSRNAQQAFKEAEGASGSFASKMGSVVGKLGSGLAVFDLATGGLGKIGSALGGLTSDFQEAQKVQAQTEQVLRSTAGAAGVTAGQVGDLATQYSKLTPFEDETVQSAENLLLTFCLEDSAEALVRDRGWVGHAELRAGDEILAYDPEDGSIRWEPVASMHRFQVSGDLIRWKSKQINVATTPRHRWWTTGRTLDRSIDPPVSRMQPHRFRTTEEIGDHQFAVMIGGGAPMCFPVEPTWSDDLVELAGWVVTEGWFKHSDGSPGYVGIGFCQSETNNPEKTARIRDLVERLRDEGHRVNEHSYQARYNASTMAEWSFARELGALVRDMVPDKKLTAGFLTRLTHAQADLLLDVLLLADGSVDRAGHRQFLQKDTEQLGIVAMLGAMLGRRTRMLGRGDSLYFAETNYAWGHNLNAQPEHYDGVVWCPHLRTGIFMARCNGGTFWTGNTSIGKDTFPLATKTVLDMSQALGQDTSSSAIQLGKALQDPVKGVTALQRVGVNFNAAQKEQIASMVKAGDVAGAQALILKELQTEFGGSAEAAGKTLPGALAILNTQWGNVKEVVGGAIAPLLTRFATDYGPRIVAWAGNLAARLPELVGWVQRLATVFGGPLSIAVSLIRDIVSEGGDLGVFGDDLHELFGIDISPLVNGLRGLRDVIDAVVAGFRAGGISGALAALLPAVQTGVGNLAAWIVSTGLPTLVGALQTWAGAFLDWIGPLIPPLLTRLGELIGRVLEWVGGTGLPLLAGKLQDWGAAFVDWIGPRWPAIQAALGAMLTQLGAWMTGTALPGIISHLAEWGGELVAWVAPRIPPLLVELGNLLLAVGTWLVTVALPIIAVHLAEWGGEFVAWVGPRIPPLLAELGGLLLQVAGWMLTVALPAIVGQLAAWGLELVKWVAPQIPPLLLELGKLLLELAGWMIGVALPTIVGHLLEWGGELVRWVGPQIPPLLLELGKLLLAIGAWVVTDAIPRMAGFFADMGKRAGEALVDAILEAVKSAWHRITDWIKDNPITAFVSGLAGGGGGVPGGGGGAGGWIKPIAGTFVQGSYVGTHRVEGAVDWAAPRGTPVYAPNSGVVAQVGWGLDGNSGRGLSILHPGGYTTVYGHMAGVAVAIGQALARGQLIGFSGSPELDGGAGSGAHLHLAMHGPGGGYVRPEDYIPLARGGLVLRPTFALLGERGPEAVVPLSRSHAFRPIQIFGNITVQQQPGATLDELLREVAG